MNQKFLLFQLNLKTFYKLIMNIYILYLFILQIYSQIYSSITIPVNNYINSYYSNSTYSPNFIILPSIVQITAIQPFPFYFQTDLININTYHNTCNLALYVKSPSIIIIYKIIIKILLIKNDFTFQFYLINITQTPITLTFNNITSSIPNIQIIHFIIGWNYSQNCILNYNINTINNTFTLNANLSNYNWIIYAILAYPSNRFSIHYSQYSQNFNNFNSDFYGFQSFIMPNHIGIQCINTNCNPQMNSYVWVILYNNTVNVQKSTNGLNWLLLGVIIFSSAIFLILMLITIRILKNKFCNNEIIDEMMEDTGIDLIHNKIEIQQVSRKYQLKCLCCICLDEFSNCILLPCQHAQYCKKCVIFIIEQKKECSICRSRITKVLYLK